MPPEESPCAAHGSVLTNQTVLAAGLKRIEDKLDGIISRMGTGDTTFAVLQLKVAALETSTAFIYKVVFGLSATIILAVIGAVLKLVIH